MTAQPAATEASRIALQIRASYRGPAWHGPSLRDLIADVTAEVAARRPENGGRSIWELVLHAAFWARIARETVEGAAYRTVEPPGDWPAPAGTWEEAQELLGREQRALIQAVREMDDSRLVEQVSEQKGYNFYILLHGVAQHNIYHAGQIALLKK